MADESDDDLDNESVAPGEPAVLQPPVMPVPPAMPVLPAMPVPQEPPPGTEPFCRAMLLGILVLQQQTF